MKKKKMNENENEYLVCTLSLVGPSVSDQYGRVCMSVCVYVRMCVCVCVWCVV